MTDSRLMTKPEWMITHEKSDEERFGSIHDKLDAHFEAQGVMLGEIKEQVKKTNGRVTFLEKFMWVGIGSIGILTPWAFWITTNGLSQDVSAEARLEIRAAVDEAFDRNLSE